MSIARFLLFQKADKPGNGVQCETKIVSCQPASSHFWDRKASQEWNEEFLFEGSTTKSFSVEFLDLATLKVSLQVA